MLSFFIEKFVFYNENANFAQILFAHTNLEISQETYVEFQNGKIDSFYASAYASLLSYTMRTLGDEFSFLAEDCVQDAVYEAYQKRDKFAHRTQLKSYLYRCVHNNAMDILRKNRIHCNYALTSSGEYSETDLRNTIIEQETYDLLCNAIDQLPEDLHVVFTMAYEQKMKNKEIADALGISVSTVKNRKVKLISTLRQMLTDDVLILLLVSSIVDY